MSALALLLIAVVVAAAAAAFVFLWVLPQFRLPDKFFTGVDPAYVYKVYPEFRVVGTHTRGVAHHADVRAFVFIYENHRSVDESFELVVSQAEAAGWKVVRRTDVEVELRRSGLPGRGAEAVFAVKSAAGSIVVATAEGNYDGDLDTDPDSAGFRRTLSHLVSPRFERAVAAEGGRLVPAAVATLPATTPPAGAP